MLVSWAVDFQKRACTPVIDPVSMHSRMSRLMVSCVFANPVSFFLSFWKSGASDQRPLASLGRSVCMHVRSMS